MAFVLYPDKRFLAFIGDREKNAEIKEWILENTMSESQVDNLENDVFLFKNDDDLVSFIIRWQWNEQQ